MASPALASKKRGGWPWPQWAALAVVGLLVSWSLVVTRIIISVPISGGPSEQARERAINLSLIEQGEKLGHNRGNVWAPHPRDTDGQHPFALVERRYPGIFVIWFDPSQLVLQWILSTCIFAPAVSRPMVLGWNLKYHHFGSDFLVH